MSKQFKVFGYCPCFKCNGRNFTGVTASGTKPQANHTIVAPIHYRFGTKIVLDGYGTFYVEDRGDSSLKGNRLDRFFDTHQEVLNWGVKYCKGTVYN